MPDDKDDDFQERVQDMADRMGLEGSDRRRYVHESMTRAGYKAVPTYVKADDDDDDDDKGSGFFGGRRRSSGGRERDGGRSGGRRRSRDDDDDWYS